MFKLLVTLVNGLRGVPVKQAGEVFNSIRIEALVDELERQGFDRRAYESRVQDGVYKVIGGMNNGNNGRQIPQGI